MSDERLKDKHDEVIAQQQQVVDNLPGPVQEEGILEAQFGLEPLQARTRRYFGYLFLGVVAAFLLYWAIIGISPIILLLLTSKPISEPTNYRRHFSKWRELYHRVYVSKEEEDYRFSIFVKNYIRVHEYFREQETRLDEFYGYLDLTWDEIRERRKLILKCDDCIRNESLIEIFS
jgi:hypothetical protein